MASYVYYVVVEFFSIMKSVPIIFVAIKKRGVQIFQSGISRPPQGGLVHQLIPSIRRKIIVYVKLSTEKSQQNTNLASAGNM